MDIIVRCDNVENTISLENKINKLLFESEIYFSGLSDISRIQKIYLSDIEPDENNYQEQLLIKNTFTSKNLDSKIDALKAKGYILDRVKSLPHLNSEFLIFKTGLNMLVNSHYKNGEFVTHEFHSNLSFLIYINFQLAVGYEFKTISFLSGSDKMISRGIKTCKYFNLDFALGSEYVKEKTFLLQKVCCVENYISMLKEIESI